MKTQNKIQLIIFIFGVLLFTAGLPACGLTGSANDRTYQQSAKPIMDRFNTNQKNYNIGVETFGNQFKSSKTESEQRQALQLMITHLENYHQLFLKDMTDFQIISPPPKFLDFHLLMSSVLRDYVDAIESFDTYYSKNLNLGIQDLQLANRASTILRTANENAQRAVIMYNQLIGAN